MKNQILGIKIDAVTKGEAEEQIGRFLDDVSSKRYLVTTVNTEFIVKALKDSRFRQVLNKESSLNLPDGTGPLWAGKFFALKSPETPVLREIMIFLQWALTIFLIPFAPGFFKNPFPEKISGADFVRNICQIAWQKRKEVYFLGGGPTIAERAALQMQTEYIDLKVAGVDSRRAEDKDAIVDAINKSKADIVLVAFGAPKQEIWISENLQKTSAKLAIGLGGTFDFLAGVKKRSPHWVQRMGLEWLFRLILEPRRMIRQLSIPYFMVLVLVSKMRGENEKKD